MTKNRRLSRHWLLAIRWLMTFSLLAALVWLLDAEKLIAELSRFSILAVILALLVSVLQVLVSAWRWRFTARRLGLCLTLYAAVREYYLALFLNQCLPGGVIGDVNRAWRHGQGSGSRQSALHAVMIERLSGQVVMILVAICACIWLAFHHPDIRTLAAGWTDSIAGYWLAGAIVLVMTGFLGARLWRSLSQYFRSLGNDIYRGLLTPAALPLQVASSLMVVATYLAVFLLLALSASGPSFGPDVVTLLALCSLLLIAMVVPITVAGWGVREGAAALLWPLAGLPAEQGVALSVGYGLTVLLSSLPGGLFVFSRPRSGGQNAGENAVESAVESD